MKVLEKRSDAAEAEPEVDPTRNIYGLYEANDTWRWSLFCPQRGDVVVCRVPAPLAPEDGVYGAFVVLSKVLMSDGSMILAVKSLGSSETSTTIQLSKAFNRRPGSLHVCQGTEDCHVHDEEIVFHCRNLELADGSSFTAPYLGTAGKRLLRQVQQEATPGPEVTGSGEEGEEKKKDAETAPTDRPPDLSSAERRERSGKGEGTNSREQSEQYHKLRERLEHAKKKQRKETPDWGDSWNFPGFDPGGGLLQQAPHLSSSYKLGQVFGEAGNPTSAPMSGQQPQGGGATNRHTMSGWNPVTSRSSVGSQLVLRAAANLQEGGNGGGFPPGGNLLQLFAAGKKKKKKKRKSKKKKKKRRRTGHGGGSSGGGGSGGSSTSPSSSDESSGDGSSDESYLPPLRRKAARKPGSVLRLLLDQVESQLSELQGAEGHQAALLGGTKLLTYFHLLVRGNGVQTTSRDGRELYLIAVLLDLLRSGQLERLADGLAARFLALQTAAMDGSWTAARHLEIFTPDQATAGGAAVTLAARKHAKVLEKVKGFDARQDNSRGSWNRQWNPWHWSGNADGNKGKGKKGKGSKSKSNPWSGKGNTSWKGGSGAGGKGDEKEKSTEKTHTEGK